MLHREILLPAPFHRLELFALIEQGPETDNEIQFWHRLYMVDRFADGGKVLLKDQPAYTLPKLIDLGGA